ncbi:precorrin-6y C5,15-methyltransferase (decarboxylating) subunit CbiE [Marivita sp. S0852]|uniref:precorrin-6y C5,15-methyltransferase (decarboxylating) subunit CbiE n=1 Tax=Marivita sp. S0852 TaxID=3373893 RepID=UPI0039819A2C
MADAPWLTIIGVGEDAPDGLPRASLAALDAAEVVMGPTRHLGLLPQIKAKLIPWPVPFADGIAQLLGLRGQRVAVLASNDPFWFGAGSRIAQQLAPHEWTALPGPSTFSLVAARMGWPLEHTACFGLHAAPLARLRPVLAPGQRIIVLLRDGAAVQELAAYLCQAGFGASDFVVHESIGGPRERRTDALASDLPDLAFAHPVCAAIRISGAGQVVSVASGRSDGWFDSDGQMTKRPMRALALSALAPRPFEHLWDIGGGSGSVGIEWLLSHPSLAATSIEPRSDRAARITRNAAQLGVDRLAVVQGRAPEALADLPVPDAVFVGGGVSHGLLDWFETHLATGTRIVAHAVTLESEALLTQAHAGLGGEMLRIELARATPLGTRRGWTASYPVVQWSVTL